MLAHLSSKAGNMKPISGAPSTWPVEEPLKALSSDRYLSAALASLTGHTQQMK